MNTPEWEKTFDEKFDHIVPKILMEGKEALNDIKSFISNLLLSERVKLLSAIEKEVEIKKKMYNPDTSEFLFIDPTAVDGYNQALSDIQEILKSDKDI